MIDFLDEQTKQAILWNDFWKQLRPLSPLGKKVKEQAVPLLPSDADGWKKELNVIAKTVDYLQEHSTHGARLGVLLARLPDVERSLLSLIDGSSLTVTDGVQLKQFLVDGRQLVRFLDAVEDQTAWMNGIDDALNVLDPHIERGATFQLKDYFFAEEVQAWNAAREIERSWKIEKRNQLAELENVYGQRFSNNDEWFVPVTEANLLEQLDGDARLVRTRETPFERVYTYQPSREEKELLLQKINSERVMERMADEVLSRLGIALRPHLSFLQQCCRHFGRWDWRLVKARLAMEWKAVAPVVGEHWEVEQGRHIEIESGLKRLGRTYQPLDLTMERGATLLTGVNMGGKTGTLRTIGWLTALAYYGFFVPAGRFVVPMLSVMRMATGDDQQAVGWSSFGADMRRLADWFAEPAENTLWLIDEPARGTMPDEGEALTMALTDSCHRRNGFCLIVTHYAKPAVRTDIPNYRVIGVSDWRQEIPASSLEERMDYRLVRVTAGNNRTNQRRGEAIRIAASIGLPAEVIDGAMKWLESEGQDIDEK